MQSLSHLVNGSEMDNQRLCPHAPPLVRFAFGGFFGLVPFIQHTLLSLIIGFVGLYCADLHELTGNANQNMAVLGNSL